MECDFIPKDYELWSRSLYSVGTCCELITRNTAASELLLLSRLRQILASKFKYIPLALRFECLSSPFKLDSFFDTEFLKDVNMRAHDLEKLTSLKANESVASYLSFGH